ncbi:NAD(P)-dependent oxidoreductase [Polynucleobacter paneuropaeus]|uniref:Adenosylhomocysteinase n=1 Tax=Polynucleobacter paneuropaeus TaxID=2527775 RepID=A0A2Z4JT87_9BURK|nr:NAD(P)-dependent oxidoreductase [Polynucleobacter paneuropaeus]AWW50007.1 adenosylhomocysteinase [Polynucleobacter paneuropaeus]
MQNSAHYFNSIIRSSKCYPIDSIIAVLHICRGSIQFLEAISSFTRVAGVIPKQSSKIFGSLKNVSENYHVLDYARSEIISKQEIFLGEISSLTRNQKFAIIDIGGYFAAVYPTLVNRFGDKLIGVVEDTENGHQKYQNILKIRPPFSHYPPIISAARSALKEPEDLLVGQAIVFSAEAILRSQGLILVGRQAGVIGFGKIGRAIACALVNRGARVNILESNPIRTASALSMGFQVNSKKDLLETSQILFCATGSRSLNIDDIDHLRNEVYIFCATSADDELSECLMNRITNHSQIVAAHLRSITVDGKLIYLCNDGNPVNFIHGGVVGSFIQLVQGEIIFALGRLHDAPKNSISSLAEKDKKTIASKWMQHYQSR